MKSNKDVNKLKGTNGSGEMKGRSGKRYNMHHSEGAVKREHNCFHVCIAIPRAFRLKCEGLPTSSGFFLENSPLTSCILL